jgi:hypothetical protein
MQWDAEQRKPSIVLRLTRGPVPGCIGFHIDDSKSSGSRQTAQITLNDDREYNGGRLLYVTGRGEMVVLRRPAGTLTIHKRHTMHAVTRLHTGSRYGLYVLDACTSLGDKQVVHVDMTLVSRVLGSHIIARDDLAPSIKAENIFDATGGFGDMYHGKYHGSSVIIIASRNAARARKELKAQFHHEIARLADSQHPHLLPVVGGCWGRQLAIVYALKEGGPLTWMLAAGAEAPELLSWCARLRIMLQLFDALRFLHSKTYVHGDVKPAKIFLDGHHCARLGGFGSAAISLTAGDAAKAETAHIFGTLGYIDPSYASTGRMTLKADVYSAGVVLAELLTDCVPLDFEHVRPSLAERFREMKEEKCDAGNFASVALKWPKGLLKTLVPLVLEAIAPRVGDRPSSAEVFERLKQMMTSYMPEDDDTVADDDVSIGKCFHSSVAPAKYASIRCGHICFCESEECCQIAASANHAPRCPVCGAPVESMRRVFF